jgi:hypothetical protein
MFHSFLSGGHDWIHYYLYGLGDETFHVDLSDEWSYSPEDRDWEEFNTMALELEAVAPYAEADITPRSSNHVPVSRKNAEYILSGVTIPGGKVLQRLTMKAGPGVRLISVIGDQLRFQPASGNSFTLRGAILPSSFNDFGVWIEQNIEE